jgi:uncharacterized membrane protein
MEKIMLSMRLAVLELARRHHFPANTYASLLQSASREGIGIATKVSLQQAVYLVALLFAGLGVIFFVAANWITENPFPMFFGLELALITAAVWAARSIRRRTPLTLLGFLVIGALLAFFGQHYQSGADLWQMFAVWAALGVPLALAARSDAIWCAWLIVAMTGVTVWWRHLGLWQHDNHLTGTNLLTFALMFSMSYALFKPSQRYTGAGIWSFNLAILCSTAFVTTAGIASLFHDASDIYMAALLAVACATGLGTLHQLFDIRALSICAFGMDLLIVGGFTKMGFEFNSLLVVFCISALAALVVLGITVSLILELYRNRLVGDKS